MKLAPLLAAIGATLAVVACVHGRALAQVDPKVEAVLAHQHAYFARIQTLQLTSVLTATMSDAVRDKRHLPSGVVRNDLTFVSSGAKFRSEVSVRIGGVVQASRAVAGYDGSTAWLGRSTEGKLVGRITAPGDNSTPYLATHPLISTFKFAFAYGDTETISSLASSSKWARVLAACVSSEDCVVSGHAGTKVVLRGSGPCSPQPLVYEVFFASDLQYLPIYWKVTYPDSHYSEVKVTATKNIDLGPSGHLVMPMRLEGNEYSTEGILANQQAIDVDDKSLKVNEPVADSVFALPADLTNG
jgi:hypothetical protein